MKQKIDSDINLKIPVVIYREELQEIERILLEELKVKDLKISFAEYEAVRLDEIPTDTKLTNDIKINTYNPSLYVTIGSYLTVSTYMDESLEVQGAMLKISNILKRNSRIHIYQLFRIIREIAVIFFLSLLYILLISKTELSFVRDVKIFLIIAILCTWYLMIYFFVLNLFKKPVVSIINFSSRKETANFWKKNKDTLLVNLIVAVFSLITGYIISR